MESNLSKIKPKLRTEGQVTGNFGVPKRLREAHNASLGLTKAEQVNITTQNDYLKKMYQILDNPPNGNMKQFAYNEIRKILIQRGQWR
jgi:hypothetical protein